MKHGARVLAVLLLVAGASPAARSEDGAPPASQDAGAHLDRGASLLYQGKYDEAIAEFEAALAIEPDYLKARLNLATAYHYKKDYAKAEKEYLRCLQLDPTYVNARFNLAVTYQAQDKDDEALAAYRKVIESDPTRSACWKNMGRIHEKHGELAKAADAYERSLAVDPAQKSASDLRKRAEELKIKVAEEKAAAEPPAVAAVTPAPRPAPPFEPTPEPRPEPPPTRTAQAPTPSLPTPAATPPATPSAAAPTPPPDTPRTTPTPSPLGPAIEPAPAPATVPPAKSSPPPRETAAAPAPPAMATPSPVPPPAPSPAPSPATPTLAEAPPAAKPSPGPAQAPPAPVTPPPPTPRAEAATKPAAPTAAVSPDTTKPPASPDILAKLLTSMVQKRGENATLVTSVPLGAEVYLRKEEIAAKDPFRRYGAFGAHKKSRDFVALCADMVDKKLFRGYTPLTLDLEEGYYQIAVRTPGAKEEWVEDGNAFMQSPSLALSPDDRKSDVKVYELTVLRGEAPAYLVALFQKKGEPAADLARLCTDAPFAFDEAALGAALDVYQLPEDERAAAVRLLRCTGKAVLAGEKSNVVVTLETRGTFKVQKSRP